MKDMISALSFAVLPSGKYLLRKALESMSQVVKALGSAFCSQSLALSLSEKGKSCSLIVWLDAPLILMVSHFRKEFVKMRIGVLRRVSSELLPLHKGYECWLSSKLLASTAGLTMEEVTPDACGRA